VPALDKQLLRAVRRQQLRARHSVDAKPEPRASLRQRAFQILEHGRRRELTSRIVDWVLVLLVVGNVVGAVAQTIPDVAVDYGASLQVFDRLCVLVFAGE